MSASSSGSERVSVRPIESTEAFEELLRVSAEGPVVLLKHSTRCPVSTYARREFDEFVRGSDAAAVVCAMVLVVECREVSLVIAERLGVRHQSPQAIVIRDGEAVWNDSHERVTAAALSTALQQ